MAKASKAWYSKASKGLFSKAGKSVKSGVSCIHSLKLSSSVPQCFVYSILTSSFAYSTDYLETWEVP